jgi:hypothetical protein
MTPRVRLDRLPGVIQGANARHSQPAKALISSISQEKPNESPSPRRIKNPAKVRAGQTGQRPSKLAFRIADQWPELDAHERQLVLDNLRRVIDSEQGASS